MLKQLHILIPRFLKYPVWVMFVVCLFVTCKKEFISEGQSNSSIKYFFGNTLDNVNSVEKTKDGGFIYCGTSTVGPNNTDAFLLKIDATGRKEWFKTYGGSKSDFFTRVLETKDGNYIAVGGTKSFGNAIWNATNKQNDLVVKINGNGDQIWLRTFNQEVTDLYSTANDIVEATPNSFYITGTIQLTTSTRDRISYLQKITENGQLVSLSNGDPDGIEFIDERDFGTFNFRFNNLLQYQPNLVKEDYYRSYGMSVTSAGPGNILIGGLMSRSNIGGESRQLLNFLMSINTDVLSVDYIIPYYAYYRSGVNYTNNLSPVITRVLADGLLVASNMEYASGEMTIQLMKTDFFGNIMWINEYLGLGYSLVENMHIHADGSILLIGESSKDPLDNGYPEQFSNMKITLIKLENNGKPLWTKYIGGEVDVNKGLSAQPRTDGSYIIACVNSSAKTGSHKGFTLQVDREGNLITD